MPLYASLRAPITTFLIGLLLWVLAPSSAAGQLVQNVVNQPCSTCKPTDVEFVDLNDDGTLDVLVVSEHDLRVSWFEGQGGASFGPQQVIFEDWASIKTGSNNARPTRVTTGDLDGDGLLDVIVVDNAQSSGNGAIVYFENQTDGSGAAFGGPTIVTQSLRKPQEVVTVDFDFDGDVDLIASSSLSPEVVTWFSNDGTGVFTRETDILSGQASFVDIDVVDVEGDGDWDILAASSFDDEVYFVENTTSTTGSESYASPIVFAQSNMDPRAAAFADLDQDGNEDFLISEYGLDEIVWYPGNGDGTFGARTIIGSADAVDDFKVVDVDADGALDVVVLNRVGIEDIDVFINDGSESFTLTTAVADVGQMETLDVADVSGDARPDIVVGLLADDYVAYYENQTSTGGWSAEVEVSTPPDVVAPQDVIAADLDGDTWDDVVTVTIGDGLVWYRNQQDGTFAAGVDLASFRGSVVRAADLDQDGDLDLVASGFNSLSWYENRLDEATSDFGPGVLIDGSLGNLRDIEVADFNGDSYPDVVGADERFSDVLYFENRLDEASADVAQGVELTTSSFGAYGVDVADFDADGDVDVSYGARNADDVAWIENDFSGSTSGFKAPSIIDGGFNRAVGAWVGDFDGDGLPDIMSAGTGGTDLAYFLNQLDDGGTADFGAAVEVQSALNPSVMAVGDLTDDGVDDVAYIFDLGNINRSEIYVITASPGVGDGFGDAIFITDQVDGLTGLYIADLDKDGLPDILSSSDEDNVIAWYPNDQSVLPVELTRLSGRFDGDRVALSWETLGETDNHGFAVERRVADGSAFDEVGYVRGSGTTTEARRYRFTDASVPAGLTEMTYRLRQVDVDGSESYSRPVTVRRVLPGVRLAPIAPHPVRSSTTLTLRTSEGGPTTVDVFDLLGRRVATLLDADLDAGVHTIPLDASGWASGAYFVRVTSSGHSRTQPFRIVR